MTIESPCIRHCTLNDQDMCVGCGRMLREITGWTRFSDAEKLQVKAESVNRLTNRTRF